MDLYDWYEANEIFEDKDYDSTIDFVEYYLNIANVVKDKSKDRSTKVGCVIATRTNTSILSVGYNGFLRGFEGDGIEENHSREDDRKYMLTCHAERNAIYSAVRNGVCLDNSIAFVTAPSCHECTIAMIQSGIKNIIFYPGKEDFIKRLEKSLDVALEICTNVAVNRFVFDPTSKDLKLSRY